MVASESYRKPLLRFEQPKALCDKLPRPQAKELDGNVYVRMAASGAAPGPLVVWSPAATESCLAELSSLEAFRKAVPTFETRARYVDAAQRSIFRSPELGRYELLEALPGTAAATLPADVRKLLGWTEQDSRSAGAYPLRR
jgi:hypothetical protein